MRSLLALALSLTACTDDAFNPLDPGNPGGGDSCAEIVDCSADCQTDRCDQACFDAGSSEAQQLIGDIADCIERNQCETNDCVTLHCGDLFDECLGDPGVDPGPTGSMLPAAIVGAWQTTSVTSTSASSITYMFTDDGQVSSSSTLLFNDISGCQQTFTTQYFGVVQLAGNTLNITVTDGDFATLDCTGQVTASGPHEDPESFRFATGVDGTGDFLQLENLDTGNTLTFRR